jgi:hypothetical protein
LYTACFTSNTWKMRSAALQNQKEFHNTYSICGNLEERQ